MALSADSPLANQTLSSNHATTAQPPTGRLPSLDGWRAASIILVLGAHSKAIHGFPHELHRTFKWLFDGDLGVRCFFVISGFIITWLLLRERNATGKISLGNFYARRALRILPVYWAFLLTVGVLSAVTAYHQSLANWIANLTFTTNFAASNWTTGHLWSLAIEEQFYLVWPITLIWVGDRITRPRTMVHILAVPFLVAPISRFLGHEYDQVTVTNPLYLWSSFFNYFDSLACGCIAAGLIANGQTRDWFRAQRIKLMLASALLVGVPYVLSKTHILFSGLAVPLGPTAQAVGLAALIALSVIDGDRLWWRPLNWRAVRTIGVLSYSLYIWQMLFCTSPQVYGIEPKWWLVWPSWLVAVFAVAAVSYYGLELPLMRLRARFRRLPHRDEHI